MSVVWHIMNSFESLKHIESEINNTCQIIHDSISDSLDEVKEEGLFAMIQDIASHICSLTHFVNSTDEWNCFVDAEEYRSHMRMVYDELAYKLGSLQDVDE